MSEVLRRWRLRLARVVVWTLGALVLLGAVGGAWSAIASRRDTRRFPMPGRLVEVPGGRRHLHCEGAGSPTVVLEAGLGNPARTWALVQPAAARGTRVCAYDRGGYGYSDSIDLDPEPRVAKRLALELHLLLERAGERGPYVLVGHSFGGIVARVYTGRFPSEVAGLVLVDAAHEDAHARLPGQRPPAFLADRLRTARRLAPLGLLRLRPTLAGWDRHAPGLRALDPETRDALTWLAVRPRTLDAAAAEADSFARSAEQARAASGATGGPPLADRPLVVLVGARRHPDLDYLPAGDADRYHRIWVEELQPALARLSTRGTVRVFPDSGHSLQLERPDAVVAAIEDVVTEVRRGAASRPATSPARR